VLTRGYNQMRVISYVLFHPVSTAHCRWSEYTVGLALNASAIAELLPGWRMCIYIDKVLTASPDALPGLVSLLAELCGLDHVDVHTIEGPLASLPMLARYAPLLDAAVEVCVVRDADSILTAIDTEALLEWLASPHSADTFYYREHCMLEGSPMGGGFAARRSARLDISWGSVRMAKALSVATTTGAAARGYDEYFLKELIAGLDAESVVTRMTQSGTYHLYVDADAAPEASPVLWPNTEATKCEGIHAFDAATLEGADVYRDDETCRMWVR